MAGVGDVELCLWLDVLLADDEPDGGDQPGADTWDDPAAQAEQVRFGQAGPSFEDFCYGPVMPVRARSPHTTTITTSADSCPPDKDRPLARRQAEERGFLLFDSVTKDNQLRTSSAQPSVGGGVGGIILFGSSAPPTLPTNLAVLQRTAARGLPVLVMADEEGGSVQRLANLAGSLPWPRTMAATMTTAQTRALAEQVACRMRAAGVTMDLAPVLDLSDGPARTRPTRTGRARSASKH
jgi:hypothetical protein